MVGGSGSPGVENEPTLTSSPLRHSCHAHALAHALLPSKERRIVTRFGGAKAADGKAWVERKSGLRSGSRLIQRAEQAQSSGKRKLGGRMIAVGLNASP